jgi:molybdopterin synthase sulfur carrier subunit
MKLVYFAWVRERIGKAEEEVDLPIAVTTAGELLHWLKSRGEEYENALQYPDVIRVAINQQHVDHAQKLNGAREVAVFPPMTGG